MGPTFKTPQGKQNVDEQNDQTNQNASSSAVLDAIQSKEGGKQEGALGALTERYSPSAQPKKAPELKVPSDQEIEKTKETNNTNPPTLAPVSVGTTRTTSGSDQIIVDAPSESTTGALDKLNQKLNNAGTSRASSIAASLSEDITALEARQAQTNFAAPPAASTQVASTAASMSADSTLPTSTTGALEILNNQIAGNRQSIDPLQDPLNGINKPKVKDQQQENQTLKDVISEYVIGNEPEQQQETDGKEGEKEEDSKVNFRPEGKNFSRIPRPNSVKTYAGVRRGVRNFGKNLKDAVLDNGTPEGEGQSNEGGASMSAQATPYSAPGRGSGTRGRAEDETEESGDEDASTTDNTSSSGGGNGTPGGLLRKAGGKFKGAASKFKGAVKYIPFIKKALLILLAIIIIIVVILAISSALDSTNKTLAQAQGKTAKIFFEYFKINENKPFLKKDGLLKVTEIDNISFEYQLRSRSFYNELLGRSELDPIVVVDMMLEADVCVPLNNASYEFNLESDEDIRPDSKVTVSQKNGCIHFTWPAKVCDGTKCESDDEKLVVNIKYSQSVPQELFGNGTRLMSANFYGTMQFADRNNTSMTLAIEPPIRKCYDTSLGAGTSDFSVSCDSPTLVASAGQSDSDDPVSGNTPAGCPFYFDQENGGALQCTNGYFIVPNEPRKSHAAVDYQVKDSTGAIRSDFAVKAPISGIAYVIYNTDISSQCGQGIEIHSPDGQNIYQLFHLNPNSPALQGKVKNDSFEVTSGTDLGDYFNPGKGNRYFPDGDSDPNNNQLCWTGPHIHYVRQVNKAAINPFDEIERTCNTKAIKADARCR